MSRKKSAVAAIVKTSVQAVRRISNEIERSLGIGRERRWSAEAAAACPVDLDIDGTPAHWRPSRCDIGHDV
jgi:hypothetical protein